MRYINWCLLTYLQNVNDRATCLSKLSGVTSRKGSMIPTPALLTNRSMWPRDWTADWVFCQSTRSTQTARTAPPGHCKTTWQQQQQLMLPLLLLRQLFLFWESNSINGLIISFNQIIQFSDRPTPQINTCYSSMEKEACWHWPAAMQSVTCRPSLQQWQVHFSLPSTTPNHVMLCGKHWCAPDATTQCSAGLIFFFIVQDLFTNVTVATSRRHAALSCVRHFADARPRFSKRKSVSTVLSHNCLGRPGLRLQSAGGSAMQACRAR